MAKQSLDSSTQLFNDSVLARCDSLEVETVCQTSNSENLCLTKAIQNFSVLAESLGRDAALVQTCTSDMSSLNEHNLDSPLGSEQGGLITARPCTYNYNLHRFAH